VLRAGLGKDDCRYWRSRVQKAVFTTRDGQLKRSAFYSVAISHGGVRRNLSLYTSSQTVAAQKARDLWRAVVNHGWDAALEKLRPTPEVPRETIADFIGAVQKSIPRSPTRENYLRNLRLLAAEVAGIERKDNTGPEISRWRTRVGKVRLSELSPPKIEAWRVKRLEEHDGDVITQHSAKVSVNTILRCCKSLFGARNLKRLGLEVANPFKEVAYEKAPPRKYSPSFDVKKVFAAAEAGLHGDELKVFLLAVCMGLRRHEIDHLEWPSFDWERHVLVIRETKYFKAKTDDSHGIVPVDPELMARFYGFYENHLALMATRKPLRQNDFVVQAAGYAKPRLDKTYVRYRCNIIFERLAKWLRKHGVKTARPLHTLRKEAGSLVNASQGIHAASRFLRHSNVMITAAVYADSRGMQPIRLSDLA
jgi:integrase